MRRDQRSRRGSGGTRRLSDGTRAGTGLPATPGDRLCRGVCWAGVAWRRPAAVCSGRRTCGAGSAVAAACLAPVRGWGGARR